MLITCLMCVCSNAQKVAIVVGNASYNPGLFGNLPTPENDARLMGEKLSSLGFQVYPIMIDATREDILSVLNRFNKDFSKVDVGVFYFSGHGTNCGGRTYLVPSRTDLHDITLNDECVSVDAISNTFRKKCDLSFLFIDACRDDLIQSKGATSYRPEIGVSDSETTNGANSKKDLSNQKKPKGQTILYATKNGYKADSGSGHYSVFTSVLCKHITENKEFSLVWSAICDEVYAQTYGRQEPELSGRGYVNPYYFNNNPSSNEHLKHFIDLTFNVIPLNAKLFFGDKQYELKRPLKFEVGETYTYRVEADGYETLIENLEITENMTRNKLITLKRSELYPIKITTNTHADVYIDGKYVGRTPTTINTTKGYHRVRYVAKGYYDYSGTMNVSPDGDKTIRTYLTKKRCWFFDNDDDGQNSINYHYSPNYELGVSYMYRFEDSRFSLGGMIATSFGLYKGWEFGTSIDVSTSTGITISDNQYEYKSSYVDGTNNKYSALVDPYNEAKHYDSDALFLVNAGFNVCNGFIIEAGAGLGYHRDKYKMNNTYKITKTDVYDLQTNDLVRTDYEYEQTNKSHWYKQNSKFSPAIRIGGKFFIPLGDYTDNGALLLGGGYTFQPCNKKRNTWDITIGYNWYF